MQCGMEFVKYSLFLLNFIGSLFGLFLIFIGVTLKLTSASIEDITPAHINAVAIAVIVFGTIIFLISFLGCCGAIREDHCMVVTFGIIMLTILVVLVAIGAFAFLVVKDLSNNKDFEKPFEKKFNDQQTDESSKKLFEILQSKFECCGLHEPADYSSKGWPVPQSCCPKKDEKEGTCTSSSKDLYREGCYQKVTNLMEKESQNIGTYSLIGAGVQAVIVVFSFCLANAIKNAERRGYRV